ncbi:MAG: hypothetical protein KDD25_01910 [Bdellovibrionales bacterium]|nr:hypothetical protein [Bdellovibrionales bacterium]
MPDEVLFRKKGYFPVPDLKYIRGDFLEYVKRYIECEEFKSRGIFNDSYIQKLIKNPDQFITPLRGSEIWQIATLEIWLQEMGL